MRLFTLTAALALASGITAHPGMGQKLLEDLHARSADSVNLGPSNELIGDLATLDNSKLTPVGRAVKDIITGNANPQSSETYGQGQPAPKGSPACAKDTCCIWKYVANDMERAFRGPSGRCTSLARGAIRLGFHDASGWSKNTGSGGGADGSIVLAPAEMERPDNAGLEEVVHQMTIWHGRYKHYGVGMADLIQMGANVATAVCPLGPRIRSFVGRKDSSVACTDGLLPKVTDDADALLRLFADKTISAQGLVALVGAHTTSQQRFVDPSRAGDPQDSTPGVWDVAFYSQTLGSAPPRVFRFQSDIALAQDPRTADVFDQFGSAQGGQQRWDFAYAREYVRLSLLGVNNINDLTECSKVLPLPRGEFNPPDQGVMDKWLNSRKRISKITQALMDGQSIKGLLSAILSALGRGAAWRGA